MTVKTSRLQRYAPPLVVFFAVIVLWEVLVDVLNVQRFLLPAPSVIAEAFFRTFSTIMSSAAYTLRSAV
ncbi:MAG: hypothetical protein NZM18_01435, partial [Thermoflexales bacterium]|nr:hypothetical protein [Thermoflexales bacterium]